MLNDKAIQDIDILAIQEPGRALGAPDTHNSSSSKFHLVNAAGANSRTCFYVNKRIDTRT